jgi:hypothetical protein
MNGEDWRVEINLDDEEHGYSLSERFRSHDLDDEARKRLGPRAVVSRDGPRVFLYTGTPKQAREAERIARELVTADDLSAEIEVTHWDAQTEEWLHFEGDALEPDEEERQGDDESYPWLLSIELESRGDASAVEDLLKVESGAPVHRRWHYVTADARTEEEAGDLANRVRDRLPEGAKMWVEANPEGIPNPAFVYLESRL